MVDAVQPVLHWIYTGLRESAAMVWMTWWPLVLGFTLSGFVQSFLPRDALRERLGSTSPRSVATASLLGTISSSCSYAASAMSRALFARGSSWTNTIIFMVASTNLVIELGIVLYLLLGWQFVAAQFVGGALMILGLSLLTGLFFSATSQSHLRARVTQDLPPEAQVSSPGWRSRLRTARYYRRASSFTMGDFTMLRRELVAGFLVAGFLTVHVPNEWWAHVFLTGHGTLTLIENAVLAPLLAVVSFVCSVGNIPLAAALWVHGVAFGGVISFIFADLVTLPLLLIYRRFYGTRVALRLFLLLWLVMSAGGLLVDIIFKVAHAVPTVRHSPALRGGFPLGWTLGLNVAATVLFAAVVIVARHDTQSADSARDPVCGMTVDLTAPVATRERHGETFYFCSLRCAERFDASATLPPTPTMREDPHGDALDPVCGMTVNSASAPSAVGSDGTTYYFCGEGCRSTFVTSPAPGVGQRLELGRKPSHE